MADSLEHARSTSNPTWERLEDQIGWYDAKSSAAQRDYKRIKVLQLLTAATVPVLAAAGAAAWLTAAFGGIVLVLEGLQQLGQYQANWIGYRSTCEALRHERYLYLGGAGPYTDPARTTRTLAERIEGLISQEHAKWISARQEADAAPTRTAPEQPGS